ncbi:Uma2 family endonuclease [Aggregicoccus sp. 17bor-14]|uniref:Uma2 family endonuclease n=1 Tax=Myxococcaceae TaxID=31 RepID=UPI00129C9B34|nr:MULTISPECIES: Uma2 family endonuclease [Myxococcaceae]MBF5044760.1 Uma2 family endonuclease [Simulacricoccus sp. 17bor-14]MRI90504.1 Uma2 family endonuclease [Aggregicoccus sp. 17bor-14]
MRKPPKPATYADLEALPVHQVGEIVDGELYVSPRPASRHAIAASALGGELFGPFHRGRNGPGGWWLLDEPELHLGPDVLVPDLAGWRRERMPRVPEVTFFTLAPDWICEVLSPSTAKVDLVRKLPKYAQAGVRHAWIVDPVIRALEVFRLEQGHWLLLSAYAGDERVRAAPFEAIELELEALWLPGPEQG